MQFNCISEEGAADRGFALITSVFETGCMAHGHGPSLVLQFLSLRPAVVCAVLVTLGLGLHSWHTGWFGESGSSVSPPSQVVRLHGFPSPESQRILVRGGQRRQICQSTLSLAPAQAAACRGHSRSSSLQLVNNTPAAPKQWQTLGTKSCTLCATTPREQTAS